MYGQVFLARCPALCHRRCLTGGQGLTPAADAVTFVRLLLFSFVRSHPWRRHLAILAPAQGTAAVPPEAPAVPAAAEVDVPSPAAALVPEPAGRVPVAVVLVPGVPVTAAARVLEQVARARAVGVRVLERVARVRVARVPGAVAVVPAVVLAVRPVVRVGLPAGVRVVRADGPVGRVRAATRRTGMRAVRRTGVGTSGPVVMTRVSGIRSVVS